MVTDRCLHPLEKVRVVVAFDKIFEHKHKMGDLRVVCLECNTDLPNGSPTRKIAIKLVIANLELVAQKEGTWT